jgi:hypothetical protein
MICVKLGNSQIRKVTPAGVVTTLAGNGTSGDQDGTGVNAILGGPLAIYSDLTSNSFYFSDVNSNRIKRLILE